MAGAQGAIGINDETGNGTSTTFTIDWNESNNQIIDLQDFSGNMTLTLSNPVNGAFYSVIFLQSTSARTVTWPAAVKFPGGTAPVITTTANRADFVGLFYSADLSAYIASFNQDYSV